MARRNDPRASPLGQFQGQSSPKINATARFIFQEKLMGNRMRSRARARLGRDDP